GRVHREAWLLVGGCHRWNAVHRGGKWAYLRARGWYLHRRCAARRVRDPPWHHCRLRPGACRRARSGAPLTPVGIRGVAKRFARPATLRYVHVPLAREAPIYLTHEDWLRPCEQPV